MASLNNKIHRAYSNSRWSTHCLCYYALFLFLEQMNMTSTCLDLFTFFNVVAKIYRCKKKFQAFHPFIYTIQTHSTIVLTSRKICPKNHFNFDSIQRFKTFKVLATFFSSVVHLHNNSISWLCTLIWPFWYVNQHVQRGAEWRGSSYFISIFSFFTLMTNNASTVMAE